jgi:hypothetical protein
MKNKHHILKYLIITTFSMLLFRQVTIGQTQQRIAMEKVNEALKLQREGKFAQALFLLKEVERSNTDKFTQAVCGGMEYVVFNDSITSDFKKFYLLKYLEDTTKSILKGEVSNNLNDDKKGLDYFPFVQIKFTDQKDSTFIRNCNLDGEFFQRLEKGIYKLEITNTIEKVTYTETIKLTKAAYKLFLQNDEIDPKKIIFKLTEFDLTDNKLKW